MIKRISDKVANMRNELCFFPSFVLRGVIFFQKCTNRIDQNKCSFFVSQDTVVALQAMALYSSKAYRPKTNLTCIVKGNRFNKKYQIAEANKFTLQKTRVRRLPNELKVITEGTGCALIQVSV